MAEFDPAKPLRELKPTKEFFVGIDSDGCVFDTMGIKQRECFCPWMIAYFRPLLEDPRCEPTQNAKTHYDHTLAVPSHGQGTWF
jgi:hypothetical protein